MPPRKRPAAAAKKRPASKEEKRSRTANLGTWGLCANISTQPSLIWVVILAQAMSDSEGSVLCQSDESDVDRPIVRTHRSNGHGSQQPAALQNLAGQPCRCVKRTCFSQFSHCLEAVQAERQRFRALSHADQAFGELNSEN